MTPDHSQPPAETAPKGPSNLRLRTIWGALAAALLFGCTFGGPVSFALFFAGVQAIMLKEFYRIMRASGYRPASWAGGVAGVLVFGATCLVVGYPAFASIFHWPLGSPLFPSLAGSAMQPALPVAWLMHASAWTAGAVLLLMVLIIREIALWPNHGQPFTNISVTLGGLLYVSLPMALLNVIAFGPEGYEPRRVFLLIFLIWASDTGAYFAGKNFGQHKLAPSISPGKTWEGWAGGALLTLAVGWAAGLAVPGISLGQRLAMAAVVAVFGPLGDLAESMLKRSAGVKDSGTFLPGHGGLLDRFDAFLLVLPVLALLQALATLGL